MENNRAIFEAMYRALLAKEEECDLEKLAIQLEVPLEQLAKWQVSLNDTITVEDMLDVVVGPEIALTEEGQIVVVPEQTIEQAQRETRIAKITGGPKGLGALQEETQIVAGTLLLRLGEALSDQNLQPRDIATLAGALTSVQQAFFNRNVTNIQFNDNSGSGELLSALQGKLQP